VALGLRAAPTVVEKVAEVISASVSRVVVLSYCEERDELLDLIPLIMLQMGPAIARNGAHVLEYIEKEIIGQSSSVWTNLASKLPKGF
jgi:hypothetical protein